MVLRFEPATFKLRISSHNRQIRAPVLLKICLLFTAHRKEEDNKKEAQMVQVGQAETAGRMQLLHFPPLISAVLNRYQKSIQVETSSLLQQNRHLFSFTSQGLSSSLATLNDFQKPFWPAPHCFPSGYLPYQNFNCNNTN